MGDAVTEMTWPFTEPDVRTLYLQPSRPIRRRLFGPVDREELKRYFAEDEKKTMKEQAERWNFDFAAEKPISGGRYEWIRVGKTEPPIPCKEGDLKAKTVSGEDISNNTEKQSEQTHITDFMRKRKLSSNRKEIVSKVKRRSST